MEERRLRSIRKANQQLVVNPSQYFNQHSKPIIISSDYLQSDALENVSSYSETGGFTRGVNNTTGSII
jgi:hypothetical protein